MSDELEIITDLFQIAKVWHEICHNVVANMHKSVVYRTNGTLDYPRTVQ